MGVGSQEGDVCRDDSADAVTTRGRRQFLRATVASLAPALAGCASGEDPEATTTTGRDPPVTRSATTTDAGSDRRTARPSTSTGTDSRTTTTTTTATTTDWRPTVASEYGTAINVVEEGVDPDGSTPIREALAGSLGEDTLLFFPPGRYRIEGTWDLSESERVALVGEDATIVPTEGHAETLLFSGEETTVRSLRVEGLTVDCSTPGTGPRPLNVRVEEELVVRDVAVRGSSRAMRFDVMDPRGYGKITRMALPHGGLRGQHAVGCLVGPSNRGAITFKDCTIAGFPNNGLYASASEGPVTVEGGTYRNNGIANVRVSGPAAIRGATVECTRAPEGFPNMRGIWLRGGRCSVDGCDVRMSEVTYSDGAVVGTWQGDVRNCMLRIDADEVSGITVNPARVSPPPPQGGPGASCTNVDVIGTAAGGTAVTVTDHDSCVFDGLSVQQTGTDRNGVHMIRSDDSSIIDTTIDVTGTALRFENSAVETINVDGGPPKTGTRTETE
jgi:hypothetical protein